MKQLEKHIPGILLCLSIAIPAWLLGKSFPVIGGPVFGILFGMIITQFFPNLAATALFSGRPKASAHPAAITSTTVSFEPGIKFTSKKLLQYAVILLGFEMNLFNVIKVGSQSLVVMLFTLASAFLTAFLVGKALKLDGKMTTLIGVGTSICGGSAIAATAPVIQAEDDAVAHAISTIFLFNIVAVFIFPSLGRAFGLSDTGFGMWAGTAINDTSSVVAAGASWSSAVGNNTALAFATVVKLTRTLMIVPITLVLAIYTARKSQKGAGSKSVAQGPTPSGSKNPSIGEFEFVKIFPWFVIGFVIAAIANTFLAPIHSASPLLVMIGKFIIVMSMTAIGLNTHLKKLIANGIKPIFLGLCCWFVVAGMSLIVQATLHLT